MEIRVQNLKKAFLQGDKEIVVLSGVDFVFEQGKSYAISGASGTGKSTLLHLIAGIDKPDSGRVLFNNKNINLDLEKISHENLDFCLNKTIGLMFQSPYLISELSVIENIAMPAMIAGESFEDCKEHALEILRDLGVEEKAYCEPDTLSGGQQQRVALGRAIFNEPKFLLADEPTGNLDPKTGKIIVDLLLKCKNKWGMGLIVCSHDSLVWQSMDLRLSLENCKLKII